MIDPAATKGRIIFWDRLSTAGWRAGCQYELRAYQLFCSPTKEVGFLIVRQALAVITPALDEQPASNRAAELPSGAPPPTARARPVTTSNALRSEAASTQSAQPTATRQPIDQLKSAWGLSAKPHRNRGIRRYALQFIQQQAPALGVKALHLQTEAHNGRAKQLYESLGFTDKQRSTLTWRTK